MLNIVLIEPEIPQNTGNIARTCACTGARLHLVEPMGFRLTQRNLARAGCDYWDEVEIVRWPCVEAFLEAHEADLARGPADELAEGLAEVPTESPEEGLAECPLECPVGGLAEGPATLSAGNLAMGSGYDSERRPAKTHLSNPAERSAEVPPRPGFHFFTGRASRLHSDVSYGQDDYLLFGRESSGIDPQILARFAPRCVRIPMREGLRSLNLSNAVAITVYEALRQQGFSGLK